MFADLLFVIMQSTFIYNGKNDGALCITQLSLTTQPWVAISKHREV